MGCFNDQAIGSANASVHAGSLLVGPSNRHEKEHGQARMSLPIVVLILG
jgi:hypothetical protein